VPWHPLQVVVDVDRTEEVTALVDAGVFLTRTSDTMSDLIFTGPIEPDSAKHPSSDFTGVEAPVILRVSDHFADADLHWDFSYNQYTIGTDFTQFLAAKPLIPAAFTNPAPKVAQVGPMSSDYAGLLVADTTLDLDAFARLGSSQGHTDLSQEPAQGHTLFLGAEGASHALFLSALDG
jgi:hypothetical protein